VNAWVIVDDIRRKREYLIRQLLRRALTQEQKNHKTLQIHAESGEDKSEGEGREKEFYLACPEKYKRGDRSIIL
jgi:hypothetical protein